MKSERKTVLVTGGAGYIGSHVVLKLGEAGAYIETLRGVGYRFRDQPDAA